MSASGQGRIVVSDAPQTSSRASKSTPSAKVTSLDPVSGANPTNAEAPTHDEGSTSGESSQSENEYRPKRSRKAELRLTEEEYIMVAKDIMGKPPFSGYLKYHLPLRYAARCEEVRWQWQDSSTGKMYYKDLIGGGRNSDLEYD
jgi:hypothetical protein